MTGICAGAEVADPDVVGGVGVHRVAVQEGERVGEVTVEDRLCVEQATQDREWDALRLGRVDADRALRRLVAGGDQRLAGAHRR